jgi:hypothetical protein
VVVVNALSTAPSAIPEPGVSREQWFSNPADRYGLAYDGEDEDWAVTTQPLLLKSLAENRADQDAMLARFVAKAQTFSARR